MNPIHHLGLVAAAGLPALGASTTSAWTSSDVRRSPSVDAALVSFDFVDLGEPGVNAGDYFVQTDSLTVDGRAGGTDLIHCVAAGQETDSGVCDAVLVLGDATLTAAG